MAQRANTGKSAQAEQRRRRLATALRSNLKKRKDQALGRAKTEPAEDEHHESDHQGRR
jgi:hypothetical protein